jgi:hypothetical protein
MTTSATAATVRMWHGNLWCRDSWSDGTHSVADFKPAASISPQGLDDVIDHAGPIARCSLLE